MGHLHHADKTQIGPIVQLPRPARGNYQLAAVTTEIIGKNVKLQLNEYLMT